jgi:microcystin-dependent protein
MPASFPVAFDVPANPNLNTSMAGSGFEHDLQHVNINDMMKAVQLRIGINGSPDTSSLTYQVNTGGANITVLQGSVSTLNSQLGITNSNLTTVTNTVSANSTAITNLTATKLNLAGGTMTGQLVVQYRPPAVSAGSYTTAQLLLTNTGSADNPPQLGFQASGVLGMSLYLNASGLNAITNLGGSSLIINTSGQLNPLSFADGSIPSAKIVPGSIGTDRHVSASITNALLAPGCVDASKFAAGTMNSIQNAAGVPVGAIIMYGGYPPSGVPPGNWAFCDGSALSRTTYSTLYAYLGTLYGAGDGSTTFNLPDFRARSPVGSGTLSGNTWVGSPGSVNGVYPGWVGGEWSHVLSVAEMPSHNHGVSDPGHAHGITQSAHAHSISDPGHAHSISDGGHAHTSYYPNPYGTVFGAQAGGSTTYIANGVSSNTTSTNGTGIGIYGAATGIGIYGANANITVNAAGTGISIAAAGSSGAHNNVQPSLGVMFLIKTLPGG